MKLSKNTLSNLSLILMSTLLFVILSVLSFQFTGCDPSNIFITSSDSCKIDSYEITLTSNNVTIAAGSAENIVVGVRVVSQNCDNAANSFFVEISGSNPAGITLTGCGFVGMSQNAGSCTLTVSVPSGTPVGTYQVTLRIAIDERGSEKPTEFDRNLQINVPAAPDFSLSVPTGFGVVQGRSFTVTTNVNRTGGHAENINLTLHNLPANVAYSYDPNPIPGNENFSQLTFSADQSAVPGEYSSLAVIGNDGTIERFDYFQIFIIEPFTLSLSPDNISIAQGQSNTVDVNINKIGGFSESMTLTVEGGIIGQGPTLVDTTFNPNPVPWDIHSSRLTLTVGQSVAPDTYPLTVKGTVGTMVKSAELQLTVPQ